MFWLLAFGGLILAVGITCIVLGCLMIREQERAKKHSNQQVKSKGYIHQKETRMSYLEMGIYFGGFLASIGILASILGLYMVHAERKEKAKDAKTKEILSFLEIP